MDLKNTIVKTAIWCGALTVLSAGTTIAGEIILHKLLTKSKQFKKEFSENTDKS